MENDNQSYFQVFDKAKITCISSVKPESFIQLLKFNYSIIVSFRPHAQQ